MYAVPDLPRVGEAAQADSSSGDRRRSAYPTVFLNTAMLTPRAPHRDDRAAIRAHLHRASFSLGCYSHLSLAFAAAVVIHCMFDGESEPPLLSART